MFKQITAVISDTKPTSSTWNPAARTARLASIVLDIADLKHLQKIIDGVRQIPGVHDVQRLQKI